MIGCYVAGVCLNYALFFLVAIFIFLGLLVQFMFKDVEFFELFLPAFEDLGGDKFEYLILSSEESRNIKFEVWELKNDTQIVWSNLGRKNFG